MKPTRLVRSGAILLINLFIPLKVMILNSFTIMVNLLIEIRGKWMDKTALQYPTIKNSSFYSALDPHLKFFNEIEDILK
jgi:hypothetical protein